MVQFNLLPDVKVEFINARRQKHLLSTIALIAGAICLGIFIISFFIANVAQKQYLKSLNGDIAKNSKTLREIPDINKILTVQNQLGRLTELHEHKPVTSRVFEYLTQVTPKEASLNKLNLDYSTTTLIIGGKAPSLNTIRIFTETLKATQYESADGASTAKAFSEVVLTTFTVGEEGTDFTIAMKFDPIVFDGKQEGLKLNVPVTAGANKEDIFKESN